MTIKLFDSLKNTKVAIEDLFDKDDVKVYGCGVTVYDHCHIGHGRVFVFYDSLVRALTQFGYKVRAARNITDIDDKIIKKALEADQSCEEITSLYTQSMHDDIKALNCHEVAFEPKATDCINDMIEMIKSLIDKQHAYATDKGEVLFSISSFSDYGSLSGQKLDELNHGARVESDTKKKDKGDFTLWKPSKNDEPSWSSPWGKGRPGWHIECSAMIDKLFKSSIDIHLGGADLKFPHHENEIAQSECCFNRPLSKLWMHIGFVQVKEEKMSKSLGNFVTLKDLLGRYCSNTVRLFYLMTHYRQPLAFTDQVIKTAYNTYESLKKSLSFLKDTSPEVKEQVLNRPSTLNLEQHLYDDLNYPELLTQIFAHLKILRTLPGDEKISLGIEIQDFMENVMGLTFNYDEVDLDMPLKVQELAESRWNFKLKKEWSEADRCRKAIDDMGWQVLDKTDGFELKKK